MLEMKIRSVKGRREIVEAENEKISEVRDRTDAHNVEKLIGSTNKEYLTAINLETIVSRAHSMLRRQGRRLAMTTVTMMMMGVTTNAKTTKTRPAKWVT